MKREIISINDNGSVTVPSEVRMTINEIASLFGVYYQSAKRIIRAIEKSGVADGDYSMTCTVDGLTVYPDYYGLDMVVAVSFRVQTAQAKIFRKWIVKNATTNTTSPVIVLKVSDLQILN
ncbi:virulence RhuM family protein [Dysgonomonas sp. ZJ279]|uniref:virulence RhuM family protein n=1 Tax=Dysgonomonas sp. ZJ279 TaxID=2709796 RepID=UPI0013ECC638|nr:virulence RhuM family protein [Dysgonomonas sp. ZJ279]